MKFRSASFQASSDSFAFQGSAGQAHREFGVETSPDHPFRIASASKTMTAVIVLQLVEAGYISLDTRLDDAVPVGTGTCRELLYPSRV
ncbi:MAG: serine hydrolase domain-containing protein [Pseudomonadota bacterium]